LFACTIFELEEFLLSASHSVNITIHALYSWGLSYLLCSEQCRKAIHISHVPWWSSSTGVVGHTEHQHWSHHYDDTYCPATNAKKEKGCHSECVIRLGVTAITSYDSLCCLKGIVPSRSYLNWHNIVIFQDMNFLIAKGYEKNHESQRVIWIK